MLTAYFVVSAVTLPTTAWLVMGFIGLGLSSFAMSGWSLQVGARQIAWTGWLQGMGAGFVIEIGRAHV